jgi:predicted CXXCH cytochrome family protein
VSGLLALVLVGCILMETSCMTSRTRDEWLRVFFDGVPVEGKEGGAVDPGILDVQPGEQIPQPVLERAATKLFVHEPFAEGLCDECHQPDLSQGFVGTLTEMCYACHDDFTDMGTTVHSPVEEGECLACHNPHRSPFEGLLVAAPQTICYGCHDEEDVVEVEAHLDMGDQSCAACHDPHQSDKEYYLK